MAWVGMTDGAEGVWRRTRHWLTFLLPAQIDGVIEAEAEHLNAFDIDKIAASLRQAHPTPPV
jgi:hypothetical protein